MTSYRVFRKILDHEDPTKGFWEPVGDFEGHDGKAAIAAAIMAMPDDERAEAGKGIFASTPAASWRELAPTVKTETKVSFS